MIKNKILDYVSNSPYNTNRAVLEGMLDNLEGSSGGSGGDEGWIGDGNTHIWITLHEGRTSPILGVCPNGTITVDWGDGTTPDTLTGGSTSTVKWTPTHNYAKPGDYIITLSVDGEMGFSGSSSDGSGLLHHSSESDTRNKIYTNSIIKVEVGNGVTSIGDYAFSYCRALTSVVIPDGVTSIGTSTFSNCHSLASVSIPNGITNIGNTAFSYCYGVAYYDLTHHTQIPTLSNTNAFKNIPTDCEIRIPAALYDAWIAETNWATYVSNIVGV